MIKMNLNLNKTEVRTGVHYDQMTYLALEVSSKSNKGAMVELRQMEGKITHIIRNCRGTHKANKAVILGRRCQWWKKQAQMEHAMMAHLPLNQRWMAGELGQCPMERNEKKPKTNQQTTHLEGRKWVNASKYDARNLLWFRSAGLFTSKFHQMHILSMLRYPSSSESWDQKKKTMLTLLTFVYWVSIALQLKLHICVLKELAWPGLLVAAGHWRQI